MTALGAKSGESRLSEKRIAVLIHLHSRGKTLEECAGRMYLGLSERTLKKYARQEKLVFPDYCPQALKVKDGANKKQD